MPPQNRRQAQVIEGARVLENRRGTAPGQVLLSGRKTLVLLPGPARELVPMLEGGFLPYLQRRYASGLRRTVAYRIYGVPESTVDEALRPIVRAEGSRGSVEVTWGILASEFIVDIKATAASPSEEALRARLERIDARVRARFGDDIFGYGGQTLEDVVGGLLFKRGKSLSAAESCTGGLLGQKITAVPGSSFYFREGYVTYSNDSKMRLLGVRPQTLTSDGAVSKACALEMARGCRARARTDYALAITGVAGPGGATPSKPVGLVYIALAGPRRAACVRKTFPGDRAQVRERAALAALDLLRRELLSR